MMAEHPSANEEDSCGLEFESAAESDSDWMPGPSRLEAPRDSALPITRVPADLVSGGYDRFRIRTDLVPSYEAVHGTVKALGGVLTSIGGLRDLTAQVAAGRSGTSLHYTARAIDLFTRSGMQATPGPYVVTRDGGTDANPLWKILLRRRRGRPVTSALRCCAHLRAGSARGHLEGGNGDHGLDAPGALFLPDRRAGRPGLGANPGAPWLASELFVL